MDRYEYKLLSYRPIGLHHCEWLDGDTKIEDGCSIPDVLNDYGRQGWEVCAFSQSGTRQQFLLKHALGSRK